MDYHCFRENLRRAVKKDNIKPFLSKYAELFNHPACMKEFMLDLEDGLVSGVIQGNVKVVELLLRLGVKLQRIKWKQHSLAYYVFRKAKISIRNEMLNVLFKNGLSSKFRNDRGENLLLQFICGLEHKIHDDPVKVAEILVNSGVSVNEADNQGFTPLLRSIQKKNGHLVSFLIKKGAHVNNSNAMRFAVIERDESMVDLLIKNGADIDEKSSTCGLTLMHEACFYNYEEVICLLIKKGADISAKDDHGMTPFSYLHPQLNSYNTCMIRMIKEFSRRDFEDLTVCETDMHYIKNDPKALAHFDKCKRELDLMASTKFYQSYTYHFVLKQSKIINKKLAHLTKNEEFVSKFEKGLHKFNYFQNDLRRILREAIEAKKKSTIVVSRLSLIFCDVFPDLVLRELARNLSLEDLLIRTTY